jgi:hypothetical protein
MYRRSFAGLGWVLVTAAVVGGLFTIPAREVSGTITNGSFEGHSGLFGTTMTYTLHGGGMVTQTARWSVFWPALVLCLLMLAVGVFLTLGEFLSRRDSPAHAAGTNR